MSLAVKTSRFTPVIGSLPFVVHFEADELGKRAMMGVKRYRRLAFEDLDAQTQGIELVVVTSSETLLEKNYDGVRAPHCRVIAL